MLLQLIDRLKAIAYLFSVVVSFFLHYNNRHTHDDVLELSEISLDLNLVDSNVRYKFTDSPVLSVAISEQDDYVIVLVVTVSSIHHLKLSHPNRIHKNNDETQTYSVFHDATAQSARDPSSSLFYVIGHAATPSELLLYENESKLNFFFIFWLLFPFQIILFHIRLLAH